MAELSTAITDPATLRGVFGCFPSGVTAVGGLRDGRPVGLAASSFTSVSLDPALVSVCAQNTSATWPVLRDLPRLGISVLAQDQEAACRALAAKDRDRFAGTQWYATPTGAVFVHRATAWLECSIHHEIPAGDHSIVVLRVHAFWAEPEAAPLVFHGSRFRQLVHSGGTA